MTEELNFLYRGETLPFRALNRKGELRWIASNDSGSLSAMTRFAPPSKPFPKLLLKSMSLVDFRLPETLNQSISINISKEFLSKISERLKIPIANIGIYVGEPNEYQKLVITDISGKSKTVMKVAVGTKADKSITRELSGGETAKKHPYWKDKTPKITSTENILGHTAILVEKIEGQQLSPKEFKKKYISNYAISDAGEISIQEWLNSNYDLNKPQLQELLERCENVNALSLNSSQNFIHGDFAPWNTIQSSKVMFIDLEYSHAYAPVIIDLAYAVWCYETLLKKHICHFAPEMIEKLVALGALWEEIRKDG